MDHMTILRVKRKDEKETDEPFGLFKKKEKQRLEMLQEGELDF